MEMLICEATGEGESWGAHRFGLQRQVIQLRLQHAELQHINLHHVDGLLLQRRRPVGSETGRSGLATPRASKADLLHRRGTDLCPHGSSSIFTTSSAPAGAFTTSSAPPGLHDKQRAARQPVWTAEFAV